MDVPPLLNRTELLTETGTSSNLYRPAMFAPITDEFVARACVEIPAPT
jgi:hypothetical protein